LWFKGSGGGGEFREGEFLKPSGDAGGYGLVDLVGFGAGRFFALESGDEFLDVRISGDEV
jgi:hypothetical protein